MILSWITLKKKLANKFMKHLAITPKAQWKAAQYLDGDESGKMSKLFHLQETTKGGKKATNLLAQEIPAYSAQCKTIEGDSQ